MYFVRTAAAGAIFAIAGLAPAQAVTALPDDVVNQSLTGNSAAAAPATAQAGPSSSSRSAAEEESLLDIILSLLGLGGSGDEDDESGPVVALAQSVEGQASALADEIGALGPLTVPSNLTDASVSALAQSVDRLSDSVDRLTDAVAALGGESPISFDAPDLVADAGSGALINDDEGTSEELAEVASTDVTQTPLPASSLLLGGGLVGLLALRRRKTA